MACSKKNLISVEVQYEDGKITILVQHHESVDLTGQAGGAGVLVREIFSYHSLASCNTRSLSVHTRAP